MRRRYQFFLLILLMIASGSCRENAQTATGLKSLEGGKVFAVPTGTVADQMVLKRFPDAKITYYNNIYDCAMAVLNRKADATSYDKPVLKNIAAKNPGLTVLDEIILPDKYGFAVAMGDTALKNAADRTLADLRASGLYDEMLQRWLPEQGEPGPMPDIPVENPAGVLRFGTSATTEPMSYISANLQPVGFDIELATRIAARLNKKLEVVDMEFGGMLPALISGKVDMIGAGLSITEERAKSVLFTDSYYDNGIAVLTRLPGEPAQQPGTPAETPGGTKSYDGQKLGVLMGSIHDVYARATYPKAEILPFNTVPDMLIALSTGKVDAAFVDHVGCKEIFAQNPGFAIGQANLFTTDIAAGFSKKAPELREKFNHFLASIKADGTYADMENRWMNLDNQSLPDIPLNGQNGVLRVGVVSDIGLPFCSRNDQEWKGFDPELSARFASSLGMTLEYTDLPFGSLIPSLASGKIDIITATMMITEERKKQIDFSDPYYASGASILVRKDNISAAAGGKLNSPDDIAGKRVGIFTGTVHDAFVTSQYPDAQILRYDNISDIIQSLKAGKIDVGMIDRTTAGLIMKRNPDLGLLSEDVLDMPLGVGFNKNNEALLSEFNSFLKEIRADGTYDIMFRRWFVEDAEEAVMPDFPENAQGKRLAVGIGVDDLPYATYMNGEYAGFDVEMLKTFAQRNNYRLEFVTTEFSALIASLAAGKVDLITDGIAITEERARQINFSDAYALFKTAVITQKSRLAGHDTQPEETVKISFWGKLANSFHSNIILENRYILILRGLWVTIIISVFAAIAGTLMGGLVCFMRMSKTRFLNGIARTFISLVRGTPVLVLLMIIYYVVFASVNINPVFVAVVAFGINFAAYVSEMFRTSIESIDRGQHEAGIASGFSKVQTFIHIILPQALRRVLPVYKGEFVSLVKMTSVVGYIAVQDLTKASDIIRSRTFDAFFPLIMAAVIYIFIAWLLTLVLDHIEVSVDPKRRRLLLGKELVK
jgi:polar amino acid transport system substrate-binding protein